MVPGHEEGRLLHESVSILIDKQNLILKNGGKWSFSYETKALIHLSQQEEWVYGYPIEKKKEIIMWIHVYPNW